MGMTTDTISIPHETLTQFVQAIMEGAGTPTEAAAITAESLVASNLRGVDSHGVQLVLAYVDQIRRDAVNLNARGHLVSENGACLVYDGCDGLGQVVSGICCDHAVRLARANGGLGMAIARRSNHYGASAFWAQKISGSGMIGMVMCNATALVAPWQGREKIMGTNAICMAVPGPRTFLLDMATTTVALNKIQKAILSGESSIPQGWAMDAEGRPTTDPKIAMKGLPMPLGGYKGTGLALMVEILCSVLSGGPMLTQVGGLWEKRGPMRASQFFFAIDVARFLPIADFETRMQFVRDTVKNMAPALGFDEVLIAGEPEWRAEETRRREGIPVARGIWNQLVDLAASLRIAAPATA